ncbi:hypothetical protein P376_6051 [Streptomyces sp. HCCB10043]|nr:hypothetical protein P376_6051 [Streptomyces sp. HCCB10043]
MEQPLSHPGVEGETFLRLAQGGVDLHDVVVESAGLVQPGGGPGDGVVPHDLLAHAAQHRAHPGGQRLDGGAGRPDPDGRGEEQVEQEPDHSADQRLPHPVPGGVGDLGDAEDEHRADRHLGHELVDPDQPSDQQRGEDGQAEAPPAQPHQGAEADGDEHADDDGVHPADAGREGRVEGHLDDQERGEGRGQRGRFGQEPDGHGVGDDGGGRRAQRLHPGGFGGALHELDDGGGDSGHSLTVPRFTLAQRSSRPGSAVRPRIRVRKPGRRARGRGRRDPGGMAVLLNPPGETPPAEGSISEAHEERADGGLWEHPGVWTALIVIGALVVAGFFLARIFGYG